MKRFCLGLTGWKRHAAALVAGALSALAMPPAGFFPVLLLTIPALVWITASCPRKREAFAAGWAFGAGYFIAGLYWISFALFVDIQAWWWVLPFSALLGPAVLGVYHGLAVLLARLTGAREAWYGLALVLSLALLEWVRGHALTGFPWNLPGYAFIHVLPVLQSVSVIGIYGLSLLTLLWAASPVFGRKAMIASAVLFGLVFSFGLLRLQTPVAAGPEGVRIIQANIPQNMKWDWDLIRTNIEKHLLLTARPADIPLAAVIWPETAIAPDLGRHRQLARDIGSLLPEGAYGLFGTLRQSGEDRFHNSLVVVNARGDIESHFDKFHLVPFGEYIPFRDVLNVTPLGLAVSGIGDFTAGDGVSTLQAQGLPPFSPLICYEAIFPAEVARTGEERPRWIVNVTNDGWYGKTAGPHQHFSIVRVRAIEEGLPLARAANTGISGMIDAYGRIVQSLPLEHEGVIDVLLPEALPPTIYSRYKNTIFWIALGVAFSVLLIRARKVHLQN